MVRLQGSGLARASGPYPAAAPPEGPPWSLWVLPLLKWEVHSHLLPANPPWS